MIIPVKCFTCGNVLADKYNYFQRRVKERKFSQPNQNIYLTKENIKKSIEAEVLEEIQINKMCCRRHMLTHVDVI